MLGLLDLLVVGGCDDGGPIPVQLHVGDTVDFGASKCSQSPLRLAAEMKLPERGWLEFEVTSDGALTTIRQTVIFDPR